MRLAQSACAMAILIAMFSSAQSQTSEELNSTEPFYFESTALFKAFVKLPDDYDSTQEYPVVIGLHGGGNSHDNFIDVWENIEDLQFIYVAPQAPYSWLMGEKLGYDWALWPSADISLMGRASDLTERYISDLAIHLAAKYNTHDIYLMGFSQGSIYTYIAGVNNHALFKGIICLSGPGLLEPLVSPFSGEELPDWLEANQIKNGNNLRVFIGHGKSDKKADYKLAIISKEVLLKYGYDVTFRDFEGGHVMNDGVLRQVAKWIIG